MKITITPSDIREVQEVLHDYDGVELTDEQVKAFLERNAHVCTEIAEFGAFDTETRTVISNALSRELGVGDWPCNGDGEEVAAQFFAKFKLACALAGYKPVED